jgi:hypothetical protein
MLIRDGSWDDVNDETGAVKGMKLSRPTKAVMDTM